MATATAIPAPIAAALDQLPRTLTTFQRAAIAHSGDLAISKGLQIIGRGTCRVAGHEGAPVWVVSSASRPALGHLVWIAGGRIMCDCEARTLGHRLTCSHAQLVRLTIVAEQATPASVPAAARAEESAPVAPEPEPEPPTPDPTPSGPRGPRGPRCPTCGGPVDADELEQLGECLNCLQMSADRAREDERRALAEWEAEESARIAEENAQRIPCWACGEPSTAETSHGLYCDACAQLPRGELATKTRARQRSINEQLRKEKEKEKKATAARIIAREKARERAGIPSEASPRYKTETARRAAEKEAARQKQPRQSAEQTRAEQLAQSLRLVGINRGATK